MSSDNEEHGSSSEEEVQEDEDEELRSPSSFEEEEEEEDALEKQLAEIPIGELQKARADGSLTMPSWKRPTPGEKKKFTRANKNRPVEMSSKFPVGRFREVIQGPKKVCRDPRFESLSGNLDHDGFRKRYNFLFDVELPAEKKKLQEIIKKSKDPKIIEELQSHISWIDKQLKGASTSSKQLDSKILTEHKRKEREAAKQGKQPFYLKKSEIREKRLVQKYNELKTSGKLESYIDKRRRKNASKDHRYVPYRRTGDIEQQ